jgi:type II secretory pathway pseudopilin PulG
MTPRQGASAMCRGAERQRGAVLLILVAVLGLGSASLFLNAYNRQYSDIRREQATLAALAEAREALQGFAAAHGRLPRPAPEGSGGSEGPACTDDRSCTGLLPWRSLGIRGADAWGRALHYSVTPVFTAAPLQRTSAVATRTVLTRLPSGQVTYIAGNPGCSLGSPCLAAVLWSGGRDHAAGGDEAANRRATLHFMSRPGSRDDRVPGGPFDDLVAWLTPDQLYGQMARARVLP